MSANTNILKAVQTLINQAISTAPFDITRKGQVLAKNDDNTCSIRIDGVDYPNVPIYGDGDISAGDIVRVKIPMNNTSQMYIILPGGSEDLPIASTTEYGITKLSTAVDSTSEALAATSSAVKLSYDLATTANTQANSAYALAENSGLTSEEIADLNTRLGIS